MTTAKPNSLQARDAASHLHPQTDLVIHQEGGPSTVIVEAKGIYLYDDAGREIIDGYASLGCMALGYDEPRLAQVAYDQMRTLAFSPTFYNRSHPSVIELAEQLLALAPVPMSKVAFQNSGSEANDTAIKLVWYYNNALGRPQKKKIIGRERGYHGSTIATVSLSGQPLMHKQFDVPLPGFLHVDNPNYYRYARDGESETDFSARMAANLERLILDEGPDTIAAFFAEPVQGAGGAVFPPSGYFERIQAVLRKYDVLFVVDEVITGFGRTGERWGSETFGLTPDLMTCAKALSAGHFPISALLVSEPIYAAMLEQSAEVGLFSHGFTYAGHPVGAAVALEVLQIYRERDVIGHVREMAPHFQTGMQSLLEHPLVGEVRSVGLMAGIELVQDKDRRRPFDASLKVGEMVQRFADEHGLFVKAIGDRISCMPPLIIDATQIDELLRRLRNALDDTWEVVRH